MGRTRDPNSYLPQAPVLPPPPSPAKFQGVFDVVRGVESKEGFAPDGTKILINKKIPKEKYMSPEELSLYNSSYDLIKNSAQQIERLNQYDPLETVPYRNFIDTIEDVTKKRMNDVRELFGSMPDYNTFLGNLQALNRSNIEGEFKRKENEMDEFLNRRGYGSSTGSAEMKAALARERAQALNQSDFDSQLRAQQWRQNELESRGNEYRLRDQSNVARLSAAEDAYNLHRADQQSVDQRRQQALTNQYNLYNMGSGVVEGENQKALASMAPQLALQWQEQRNTQNANNYQQRINAINANYQNQLQRVMQLESLRQPSLSDVATNVGANITTQLAVAAGKAAMAKAGLVNPSDMVPGSQGSIQDNKNIDYTKNRFQK